MSVEVLLWIGLEMLAIPVIFVVLFCLPEDTWKR